MTLMYLWGGLALATQIWLCFRVGRSSVGLAILTFLIGFPGAVYTLFTQRGETGTSVAKPFLANLVFSLLFLVSGWGVLQETLAAQEARQLADANTPVPPIAPARPVIVPLPPEPVASVAAPAPEASAPVAVASAAAAADPVEAFSMALREAGVTHAVTRLPASTSLPAGVAEAVQVSATAKPAGGSRAAPEHAAMLFRCESAAACRSIAGAYLQQTGSAKRRVLQNGTLLLALPQGEGDESDLTPVAMASAFRKLDVRP